MCYLYVAGWWYGVVGHLESCDGNENHCLCHHSGKLLSSFSCNWHLYAAYDSHYLQTQAHEKEHFALLLFIIRTRESFGLSFYEFKVVG